jgi:ATP-dependent DNA helicase RecQ
VKLLEVVHDTKHLYKSKEVVFTLIGRVNAVITSNRYAIVLVVVLSLMILDGIIEAGSCSWILSKDIETYGIVKLPKRIGFYQE